jgi:hypothetical protein
MMLFKCIFLQLNVYFRLFIEVLPLLHYSPDLTLSNYHLFVPFFKGNNFHTDKEVQSKTGCATTKTIFPRWHNSTDKSNDMYRERG